MGGASEGAAVQGGGHLLRGTTASAIRKSDRHSKVYTSRGPRDRRVRLSAYTAIQFYDVQDRLGYDRPSKAIDWLISKARNAIEKLNESLSSDNCVPPTMVGSNSNTTSAAAAVDHLSLSRGSETPPPPELLTFYYPDNSHLVSNPAICFPGFSGEEVPRDLGLSLYPLKAESDNKQGNSSQHHRHTVNPFDENFVMSSQDICLQGVPLSNAAGQWNPRVHNSMDQQSYHPVGGRQSWYLPAPFYADEEAERDARS